MVWQVAAHCQQVVVLVVCAWCGAAALLRSRWPELTREQVKAKLEAGADDLGESGFDSFFGHGRLNLAKALK